MDKKVFFLNEIDEFIEKCLSLSGIVSLDYEASSLHTRSRDEFRLGGIGISNKDNGYYLIINSLEVSSDIFDSDKEKLIKMFKRLEKKTKILVFNKSYEVSVTDFIFGHDLKVLDVLVMATAMGERSSLKELSRKYLNLDSDKWEENIVKYVKSMTTLLKALKPSRGKESKHFTLLKGQYGEMVESGSFYFPEGTVKGVNVSLSTIKEIIEKENIDGDKFLPLFLKRVIELVDLGVIEANYNLVPSDMISLYCIRDCINTVNLFNTLFNPFKEGNLIKAFSSYDRQTDLSCIFEKNFFIWDEKLARENIEYLTNKMLPFLKNLCLNEKICKHLEISEKEKLEIATTNSIDLLTEYVNPRSPKIREFNQLVMFNPRMQFCVFMEIVKFDSTYARNARFVKPFLKYTKLNINSAEGIDSAIELFKEDMSKAKLTESQIKYAIDNFKNLTFCVKAKTAKKSNSSEEESEAEEEKQSDSSIVRPKSWEDLGIGDFNRDTISLFFKIFESYYGIDFTKPEKEFLNYCDEYEEFAHFYYISMCKKIAKEISGYDSKLGRDNVFEYVSENDYGKHVSESSDPDKKYVFVTKFNPVSTETKRWKSGYHTLGTNSLMRNCLKPEQGNFLLHFDLSQAEVRVCGWLAKEESLLQAYRDGLDLHAYNASKMFKKDMEDVTKTERSAAKALTFGILYGKSTQSMYSDGSFSSVEEAENNLSLFYEAYPNIKALIDKQHRDLLEYRGVKTIFGDIIPLEFNDSSSYDLAKAERQSVNYLIQHASTCVAGESIYLMHKALNDLGIYNKPHSFTHDASEFEFRIEDMKKVLSIFKQEYLKIYSVLSENTPMDIDLEIGISVGELLHFSMDGDILNVEGECYVVDNFLNNFSEKLHIISENVEEKKVLLPVKDLYIKSSYHGKHKRIYKKGSVKLLD